MNTSVFLSIAAVFLAVLIIVVLYNMYQERQYREHVRRQFGHANQDALMNSRVQSVRDGGMSAQADLRRKTKAELAREKAEAEAAEQQKTDAVTQSPKASDKVEIELNPGEDEFHEIDTAARKEESTFFNLNLQEENESEKTVPEESVKAHTPEKAAKPSWASSLFAGSRRNLCIELEDLSESDLQWFDPRFDFMAYVSLYRPKELQSIPRLSEQRPFQIIGCTTDGCFQPAEPIPGKEYQAFCIGLQAINRNGLASADELDYFSRQVRQFARRMDGEVRVSSTAPFLAIATPLDELCARVDQTIAIHMVSRSSSIRGIDLQRTVENAGFVLTTEGVFTLSADSGETLFVVDTLDGKLFSQSLLYNSDYKGFSMLFDITRIPDGEANFNRFMELAVKFSENLGLELVDEQVRPLSAEWLREVRNYVAARQREMQQVGITPGSELAKRLFS